MKLNKILMALAATAIVGCTSDDLNDFSAKQAPEDSRLIQLDENFMLAGVGLDGNITRTHWEKVAGKGLVNKFLPIYAIDAANDKYLYKVDPEIPVDDEYADLEAQAVGLCWLGQTPGAEVYTNYQFYHFGWLNNDEAEAELECNELKNGSLYSDIKLKEHETAKAGKEADPANHFTVPDKSRKDAQDNLNYNSGIYQTKNKAIFGGDYIVYYPFNPDFKNAGTIPAKAETEFTPASVKLDDPALGKATFRYSAPVTIEGGAQAAGFGMFNLSSLVQLKVFAPEGDAAIGRKVDQIVLYSASEKLLKQANLAADKIVAGAEGTELYAETEGTKTISTKFADGDKVVLAKKAEAAKGAFITVLPTKVNDLQVLVHSTNGAGDDGKWSTIDMAGTEFKAGSAQVLNISVTAADLKADYIAVDQTSLLTALTEARVVAVDADHAATITVIGDIKLTADLNINAGNDKFITITGDDIIVPEDVTLNLNTNMVSDVRVLGTSCCSGTNGGILDIQGGTVNNVTMEPTEAKTPTVAKNPTVKFTTSASTVAAGKTFDAQAGTVEVSSAVEHKGKITIGKDATLTVNNGGDLNFRGTLDDKIDNYGTIEVKKGGKFDITAASGPTTAAVGKRMTNKEGAKFIHNVDAGVGTSVQNMNQNGEYRCRVNEQDKLNDAFLQWTACSVIEMVDAGKNYNLATAKDIPTKEDGTTAWKHKGKFIDIEVNTTSGTTFNNLVDASKGDKENIQIGNLTVTKGGLNVNFTGTADPKNSRTLTVNGNMLVKVATTLTASQKIDIKKVDGTGGNLTVDGVTLTYAGEKANKDGLAVEGDITVSGADGFFKATDLNAIKISCANFYLTDKAKAQFGNRTGSTDKTMSVTGTISNLKGCKFYIDAADGSNLLAWITCSSLIDAGEFSGARPIVE